MLFLYAITLFVSSALLFLVEPMFAKRLLPLVGGSPSVWNTAVLFFQAALLAGYAYAHASTRVLGVRRQPWLHMAVLLLPVLALPVALPGGWMPPADRSPVPWLLVALMAGVGLPFFALSAAAPLLQRWLSGSAHPAGRDPYFLYRASNLGSAVGLLGYPILIERTLALGTQARTWSVGYGVAASLTLSCAVLLRRSRSNPGSRIEPRPDEEGEELRPGGIRRLRWVTLSLVPASLMLAVTGYLTVDVAPVPLLWVIPLMLYLASFVLAFSPRAHGVVATLGRAMPMLVLPAALTLVLSAGRPVWLLVSLHLVAFFVSASVCHAELARDRPPPRFLTGFYLLIALGGLLGGTFNALVAPVVFNSYAEYPLLMVAALLLRPRRAGIREDAGARRLDLALPTALAVVAVAAVWIVDRTGLGDGLAGRVLVAGIPAVACVAFLDRPVRFGLGVGAILLATSIPLGSQERVLFADRSFFGPYRVVERPDLHLHTLIHGTTIHGAQSTDPARRREPLAFYTRSGPLGDIVAAYRAGAADRRVAVVGLGAGAMACYAEPGEPWTFYEIDPGVARIAGDPRLFTYLRDCAPDARIVLGDGRLSLARAGPQRFGLITLDAFSSDGIPIHLLTREAINLYLQRLAHGGLLAFHVSNRYLDLEPVLGTLARDSGVAALVRHDLQVNAAEERAAKNASSWLVMARRPADLGPLSSDTRWRQPMLAGDVWTDDFSNIFGVFDWS